MNKVKKLTYSLTAVILLAAISCQIPLNFSEPKTSNVPHFNADSAYNLLCRLVSLGPRVPNTPSHRQAQEFIVNYLKRHGAQVKLQKFQALRYDSLKMELCNIEASFFPEKKNRILLFTHWDSRFMADREKDSTLRNRPIPGANDGASGVAILLEISRHLTTHKPNVGIDIVLFDAEDQGPPLNSHHSTIKSIKFWSLGSQYWVKHVNLPAKPLYAIGVDMVGAKGAKFAIEDFSLFFYGYLIKKIWQVANYIGYGQYFVPNRTSGILNDHVIISQNSDIRAVMIIENIPSKRFGDYWHTHQDSCQIIDPKVLEAVGQTLLTIIYNE